MRVVVSRSFSLMLLALLVPSCAAERRLGDNDPLNALVTRIVTAPDAISPSMLRSYQLPSLLVCCIEPFLIDCKWQYTCALDQFLQNMSVLDGRLMRCHDAEMATIRSPPNMSAPLSCVPRTRRKVWMSLSVMDESVDLVPFLVHHACLGVQHFIIFDESPTSMLTALAPSSFTVQVLRSARHQQNQHQQKALQIARHNNVDWLGFFDTDELLYVPDANLIGLLEHSGENVAEVSFPWMIMPFGTSPTTIALNDTFGELNKHVKSFMRPAHVSRSDVGDPHSKQVSKGFRQVVAGTSRGMGGPFHPLTSWTHNQPLCFHFHMKQTVADLVRKKYRGTGDSFRAQDVAGLQAQLDSVTPSIAAQMAQMKAAKRALNESYPQPFRLLLLHVRASVRRAMATA